MENKPAAGSASIAVLMGVYNGARFLGEQIQSIGSQTVEQIDMWVSDDGSTDTSLNILKDLASRWTKGSFHIVAGPQRGFSENFRSLMRNNTIEADYIAFSDQDDLWDADKLEAAIGALSAYDPNRPALYGGRTRIVDETGRTIGFSPHFRRQPGFGNAIVQSIAGGNTMVANRAAWDLLSQSADRTPFVSHDWWCYLMISGCGGVVIYDPNPHIGYRQHGNNLVGDNVGWRSRIDRIRRMFGGQFADWSDQNLEALRKCRELLNEESRDIVDEFQSIRSDQSPARRLHRLHNSSIYRQSRKGNLGLHLAAVVNKL
ncbi:glycosyltransferase family 2 protein [Hoeflea sp.]|uniref:glycosyltransferase family 2 protein n=1 Tax=Hoeflea sp. TaxID=1940281 RepID=UPI003B015D1A